MASLNYNLKLVGLCFAISLMGVAGNSQGNYNLSIQNLKLTENKGQIIDTEGNSRPDISFVGNSSGMAVYLRATGISYVMMQPSAETEESVVSQPEPANIGQRIDVNFIGCNSSAHIQASKMLPGHFNYYLSHCDRGILNVNSFSEVTFEDIYNGVDIVYYGIKENSLKYDFVVKPGANTEQIKIQYEGIEGLRIGNGDLIVNTKLGIMHEQMPRIYQEIAGKIKDIKGEYVLTGDVVSLKVGKYNKAYSLIIDPWVSYLGSDKKDKGYAIASHNNGDVTISGTTQSANFPVRPGAFQQAKSANIGALNYDVFISQLSADGTTLKWSTFYGGNGNEDGLSLAVDIFNNVVLTGVTSSTNFPKTIGGGLSGSMDAFVIKLNGNSGSQIWGQYTGGNLIERGYGITTDATGNIVLTGSTTSTSGLSTAGVLQQNYGGGTAEDIFLMKYSAAGNILWATYLGGSSSDIGYAVAIDKNDEIIITGETQSAVGIASIGAYQTVLSGGKDVMIAKINSSGSAIVWSTYYGGTNFNSAAFMERGIGVDTDSKNNIVITGTTASSDFPITTGAFQTSHNGVDEEGFVLKLNSAGTPLWCTYVGGPDRDETQSVVIDPFDNIYIAGDTYSSTMPASSCAYQATLTQGSTGGTASEDNMILKFDPNGSLLCMTYLGGTSHDDHEYSFGFKLPVTGPMITMYNGFVYIVSSTSGGYPVTSNALQTVFGGQEDAVVAMICGLGCSANNALQTNFATNNTVICKNTAINFNDLSSICDTIGSVWEWSFPGGVPASSTDRKPNGILYNIPGNYDVKLVIKTPCGDDSITKTSYITVDGFSLLSLITNSISCNGSNDGAIQINLQNGIGAYNYNWNPAVSTGSSVTGLSAGTYTINVVDAAGCKVDSVVVINEPPLLTTAISSKNNIRCFGGNEGYINTNSTGGVNPYNFVWSNALSTQNISSLSAGNYSLTVTDANGCTSMATTAITQPPLLGAFIPIQKNLFCYNDNSGELNGAAIGGVAPYNYNWSTGSSLQNISALASGNYSLTVSDANGCSARIATLITQPTKLTANVTGTSSPLCFGLSNGTATIGGSGATPGYTYLWPTIPMQATAAASSLAAGVYTPTITDAYGCSITLQVVITEPPLLNGNIVNQTNPTCAGKNDGSATIAANGGTSGYAYIWSTFPVQTTALATALSAGSYSVIITDANGCTANTTININQPTIISLTVVPSPSHCNSHDGTALVNVSGGTPNYTYVWNNTSTNTSNIQTGLAPGNYTITVTDANGCDQLSGFAIGNINGVAAQITTSSPVKCFGSCDGSASAIGVGGSLPYIYIWNANPTATTTPVSGLCAGTSTIVITDANGCTDFATVNITAPPALTIQASALTSICEGQAATITASLQGGTPNYSYFWNTGQNTSSINTSPSVTTNYNLTATDANGCTALITTTVNVNALPQINFTSDKQEGCGPLCITLNNTTLNSNSATWNFGDGSSSSGNNLTYHCYDQPGHYTISLIVADNNACVDSLQANNYIHVFPSPVAAFSFSPDNNIFAGTNVLFKDDSQGATTWHWNFGDPHSTMSTEQNPAFIYENTSTYLVQLHVTNEFGCTSLAERNLTVIPLTSFFIPNTFTPNGDNVNDVFLPKLLEVNTGDYEFLIYDRWGNLIFSTNNPYMGWDGVANEGKAVAQEDTYVWKIRYQDVTEKRHSLVGHINLIK